MNFLIIFLIMLMNLNIDEAEKYLGKDIDEIKEKIDLIENKGIISGSSKTYSSAFEKNQIYFLNRKCRRLSVRVNENDTITSISIATKQKIDNDLFLLLIEKYGEPTQMQKMGTVKKTEYYIGKDYTATTVIGDPVNCSFKDEPTFIIWEKPEYRIHIKMDYLRDTSLIRFQTKK